MLSTLRALWRQQLHSDPLLGSVSLCFLVRQSLGLLEFSPVSYSFQKKFNRRYVPSTRDRLGQLPVCLYFYPFLTGAVDLPSLWALVAI